MAPWGVASTGRTTTSSPPPGSVGEVPVYNVSVPVIGRDFCVFELSGAGAATAAVH